MRLYRYVGPDELRRAVAGDEPGAIVRSVGDLEQALRLLGADSGEPCTFVIDTAGELWLAHRRSEHVACAGGGDVFAAGEIAFARDARGWRVERVSNQSTGYCPEPESWTAVARCLDTIGARHAHSYTDVVLFRRCLACAERNLVKDDLFVCDLCGADLPATWNFEDRVG